VMAYSPSQLLRRITKSLVSLAKTMNVHTVAAAGFAQHLAAIAVVRLFFLTPAMLMLNHCVPQAAIALHFGSFLHNENTSQTPR
jgi:hypothetical protein